jgi:hypothetical protein
MVWMGDETPPGVLRLTRNVGISTGFGVPTGHESRIAKRDCLALVLPCTGTALQRTPSAETLLLQCPLTLRTENTWTQTQAPGRRDSPTEDGSTASNSSKIRAYRGSDAGGSRNLHTGMEPRA